MPKPETVSPWKRSDVATPHKSLAHKPGIRCRNRHRRRHPRQLLSTLWPVLTAMTAITAPAASAG